MSFEGSKNFLKKYGPPALLTVKALIGGGEATAQTEQSTPIKVNSKENIQLQAYQDSLKLHDLREEEIELVEKNAKTREEAEKISRDFFNKHFSEYENAVDRLLLQTNSELESLETYKKIFPDGTFFSLDRFAKPVQEVELETYTLPDGVKRPYNELIKTEPKMKDPNTFEDAFHKSIPVLEKIVTPPEVLKYIKREVTDTFAMGENPLRKNPKLLEELGDLMKSYVPGSLEDAERWRDQLKPDYPERYAKLILERQERENDSDVKKIIKSGEKNIEDKKFLLEEKLKDPDKWYEIGLETRTRFFPERVEEFKKDMNGDRKLFQEEIENNKKEITEYEDYIKDLEKNPEKNKKTYEELLEIGHEFQKNAGKLLQTHETYKYAAEHVDELFTKLDETHKWLIETIKSPEYKKRLEGEGLPSEEVENRLNRANSSDFNIVIEKPNEFINSEYNTETKTVKINATGEINGEHHGLHEEAHRVTDGEKSMSEYAKNLYREAVTSENLTGIERLQDWDPQHPENHKILGPTELDARKKVFEMEIDRMGIKKYGETFTQEHYKKLLELQKQGKVSENVDQFLRIIKSELFEKVMNTIAEADQGKLETNFALGYASAVINKTFGEKTALFYEYNNPQNAREIKEIIRNIEEEIFSSLNA